MSIANERDYFYEHKEEVLEAFLKENPLKYSSELINAFKEAKYDTFILLEYADKTAVVADLEGQTYSVQALLSPFNELFTKKPLIMRTTHIPYKNRYFLDGLYSIIQGKIDKKLKNEIDKISAMGIPTKFRKEDRLTVLPVSINLTIFCDALHFEEMDEMLLRNIPREFTQKMVDTFKDMPFERVSFCSSFVRSLDFLNEINGNEEAEARLFNGLSVTNYELHGDEIVIPYDILEHYYKQKSLDKSVSKIVYQNIQDAKEIAKDGEESMFHLSTFYTMLGVFYIFEENIDEFNFLENIYSKKGRKKFTKEIESLFKTFTNNKGFEITPIFLDVAFDLKDIAQEIKNYREYVRELYQIGSPKMFKKYSLNKGE